MNDHSFEHLMGRMTPISRITSALHERIVLRFIGIYGYAVSLFICESSFMVLCHLVV